MTLLFHSRPSTVPWSIGTVVVDAIQRQFWRRVAHVSVEAFPVQPAFANGDAAPSVIRISRAISIEASGLHGLPDAVSAVCRLPRLWRFPVLETMLRFVLEASARFGRSQEIVTKDDAFVSAIAAAKPPRVWFAVDERQNGQSIEPLTSDVLSKRHSAIVATQDLIVKLT